MATAYDFPALTQSETWAPILELTDESGELVNLTGCVARLTIRKARSLSGEIPTGGDLTVGDGLTLGGAAGTVTILRTTAQTALWPGRRYFYEIKITYPNGETYSEFEGRLIVKAAAAVAP